MSFIEADHVSFIYDADTSDSVPAIKDLSLSIDEGDFVAVLGHNGSGKSTFAKLLNLILLPTEGHLTVAGHQINAEMTDEDVFDIRRQVGMVFQRVIMSQLTVPILYLVINGLNYVEIGFIICSLKLLTKQGKIYIIY
jgi:ABC-type methionine transport system ATPase subunit